RQLASHPRHSVHVLPHRRNVCDEDEPQVSVYTLCELRADWLEMDGLSGYRLGQIGDNEYEVVSLSFKRTGSPKIVKKQIDRRMWNAGRVSYNLYPDYGRKRFVQLAELVLLANGIKKPGPEYEVCHNNGDRTNNRLENLR